MADRAGYKIHKKNDVYISALKIFDREQDLLIFDVGANTGNATRRYMDEFPRARIFAFEPVQENFSILENLAREKDNIIAEKLALGDRDGEIDINISSGNSTHSVRRRKETKYKAPSHETGVIESVKIRKLDTFVAERGIEHINILKIDTEGFESQVLDGATGVLRNQMVDILVMELMFVELYEGQSMYFDLCSKVFHLGYTVFDLPHSVRHADGQIRWGDAVFVSEKLRNTRL